jgi:hypothetical protein
MLPNMPDVDEPDNPPEEGGVIAAMILSSFGSFDGRRPIEAGQPYESIRQLSVEWQKTGAGAIWGEAHAALLGLEQDRVHELFGCIAAAGEQLGLAWTAQQDMQRWVAFASDGQPMAVRALAEVCGHFALGAAQTVGNATLRTLLLNATAQPILKKRGKAEYNPFSDGRPDWCFFNGRLIDNLKVGAGVIGDIDADQLILITESLLHDARWQLLVERRGLDYHRWRPQSIEYAVPRSSYWEPLPERGERRLRQLNSGAFRADPDADHASVAEIATDGLLALEQAMYAWLCQWPLAMAGVGAKMFIPPPLDDQPSSPNQ